MFAIFRESANGTVYDKYYKTEDNAIKAIEQRFAYLAKNFDIRDYDKDISFNGQKGFAKYQYTIQLNKNLTTILELLQGYFQDNDD